MKKGIILLLLCVICSCNHQRPLTLDINSALQIADNNQAEMLKVLNHYSKEQPDNLKLTTAIFLITNMALHNSYYQDSTNNSPALISDLLNLKADYLISNIDRAFSDWQNGQWARHLTFDDFCEYLLPYKVCQNQTLDNWREYFADPQFGDLQFLEYNTANHSAYRAAEIVVQTLAKLLPEASLPESNISRVLLKSNLAKNTKTLDCVEISTLTAATLRAKGIPACIDFTPQWPNAMLGHQWCVFFDNSGKNIAVDLTPPVIGSVISRPASKIYRRTVAMNPSLTELKLSNEDRPEFFHNVFMKDVTEEYQISGNIEMQIEKTDRKYAYLCTFNCQEWNPIAFGKVKKKIACFEKMGFDIMYLPAVYKNNSLKPVGSPFILTLQGEKKTVEPDITKKQTLKLYRKHPASFWWAYDAKRVMDSEFQAANHPDFSDAVTLQKVELYGTESGAFEIDTTHKYRYWRHLSAPEGFGAMAEVYFLRNGKNITDKGTVIGVKGQHENSNPANVFDNNPVTFYDAPAPSGCWAGVDFGLPITIDKILYIPKSDANGITWGDEYELKYWDKDHWQSLDRKIADNIFIEFENCPTGALFWLHDCTRGVEDRIFTYENGKQIFW